MPYIPHTKEDIAEMLMAIGAPTIETLFDEIPDCLKNGDLNIIPEGISEMLLLKKAEELANKNKNHLCFIGAGSYEHHIPAAVSEITSRGEFLTAYTPYQAEASQGTLQLLYEFQTMIAELTAMDVANASMYDGATALAEAVLMAARISKYKQSHRVLVLGSLHPFYHDTLSTILCNQQIEIITLPFDKDLGITNLNSLDSYCNEEITALVIPQPNFFGCLELVDELTDWAHKYNIISIASVNPISLGLLKPPGLWGTHGVDIACGEGQPLGVPMASGGPYFGFFTTKKSHVRQMPGRLVGRTLDKDNKPGFTLTLQAREQHIRRAKATSNICTNQGLMVTMATIHMSLLGPEGLLEVAQRCYENTHQLVDALTSIRGITKTFQSPFFHEALLTFDRPVKEVLESLHKAGIAGGYPVGEHYPNYKNSLLVCATEMRTIEDILCYKEAIEKILKVSKSC